MKDKIFKTLNIIVIVLNVIGIICPLWIFYSKNTPGISSHCISGVIVFMIGEFVIYKSIRRIKHGREILFGSRVALLFCIAGLYLPSIVITNFYDNKSMYKIKRTDYIHGVLGVKEERGEKSKKILPEKLPRECENYKFVTNGWEASNYATCCLMFRTDAETIERYAEYYGGFCDKISADSTNDEIMAEYDESEDMTELLDDFLYRGGIYDNWGEIEYEWHEEFYNDKWHEGFENSELYLAKGRPMTGALLDRDSGYVVIVT